MRFNAKIKRWSSEVLFGFFVPISPLVCLKSCNVYEHVQVFTLIWVPQRCKHFSLLIWTWWYPNPDWTNRLDPRSCVSCLSCWFANFMAKNGFVSRNCGKMLLPAAVKLHCWTSENKFSNNLWCDGWMSLYSEMLGSSALQWLAKKNWDLVLCTKGLFVPNFF